MADCICTRYSRATEWAALAGARWLGRADEEAAEEAAASGMRAALDELPIDGRVVIGARAGDVLPPDGRVGAGGERVDLALDPIEGRGVVARGGVGAMAMLAAAHEGALRHLPDMYMRSIAVGPRARSVIDLNRPVADNVRRGGRELRPPAARHHGARPRPAAPPRPDRGAAQRRDANQAHRRRDGHRLDLGRGPRHERPSRDRDRRNASGRAHGRRAPLPRRRDAGAALADDAHPDRGGTGRR